MPATHLGAQTVEDLPLTFDPATGYQDLTVAVPTSAGEVMVKYRFYKAIPYVARPVDVAYQSLNISVPTEINGQKIDASAAPILLANGVGGYMPSSVATASGIDDAQIMAPPPGTAEAPSGSAAMIAEGAQVSNAKLALAAGYVVVEPGVRGRTLQDASGTYYGVAPAAIVDLKAAVRWLRLNAALVPGNTERIVSSGTSAGGALSVLLGATGDRPEYQSYLKALGAADTSDSIFATGAWCPITDLDHADMAYEWNWGGNPMTDGTPDAALSSELAAGFPVYQDSLRLMISKEDGPLTTDTYPAHLLQTWLIPEATAHIYALPEADRAAYLAANPQIGWASDTADFDWAAFLAHVGPRKKSVPAFDALDLSSGENSLFGAGTTAARHFTDISLRKATGNPEAALSSEEQTVVALMNPMAALIEGNKGRARNWWFRVGAKDTDTALTIVGNLDAAARGLGDTVSTRIYWDAGHGANLDAEKFIDWIGQVTTKA